MIDSDHTSSSLFSDDENDSTLLHQLAISRLNQQHKLQKQKPKHFDIDFCCPGHVIDLCRESELITMLQQIAKPTLSSSIYSLIIHFYADSFKRCSIMDQHLVILAQKWRGKACRVVRIRATEAPFLVTKWAVKALPHIAIVLGDKLMDRYLF